ncbi:alpha/beta fold hydrolase [Ulvibacter litoralis]|uniref:Pimeloyl-ACP methyl ester carboxylesterase n=1 Tax=Ulvibacter litoralis TaxID=227084 RepID=A0A1G7J7P1_9FLAO|nr:alpha/beta fold hydrolase [Ulvibacter litoralis]GHC64242.1 alpha/beta hydrolase [Ulvibacter litoralis]SDF20885.1 Pimeloyl-ACP methyl ester carboxylesterase [Ulvibacter litoralis]
MEVLHSQILGEGAPFIILHGFLGMSDNWKTLGAKFAEDGHQVHLVDQRNHGRSFHSDAFSYELMAEDLKKYCEYHSLTEITLLGHSMGGKVAMLFAVTYPEMVSKLLVADIGPRAYPRHHQDILKSLSMLDFSEIKKRSEADEVLSGYIKDTGTRQFLLKNLYWKSKGELALRINLPVLSREIDAVGAALPEGTVFEKDTLFLKGSKSEYIINSDEFLIKKHFPKASIVIISNAGHWVHSENPKEFYQFVTNFL